MWITPLPPPLAALGEGSHGSILSGNYAPNWPSSGWKSTLRQLEENGYDADRLEDIRQLVDAAQSDLFDVLAYVLFTHAPKTRTQRALALEDKGLGNAKGDMRDFLLSVLKAYANKGESELGLDKLPNYLIARYGSIGEAKPALGDLGKINAAYRAMQAQLYAN